MKKNRIKSEIIIYHFKRQKEFNHKQLILLFYNFKKIEILSNIKMKIKFFFLIFILKLLLISYQPYLKRKAFDVFHPHKVFIEAHRGINKKIFQNTKEAISLSYKYNLDSFETDTWLSQDNNLVIVHGGYMGNLTDYYNTTNSVVNSTWDNLTHYKTLKDNLSIPKLEEVMKIAKDKIFMNLEIKDPRIDLTFPYVINLIEKYDFFEQLTISSFHHDYYNKVREYNINNKKNKKIVFGFLYGRRSDPNNYIYNSTNNTLNIYWSKITKNVCDKAHRNGMAVLAWFYMDEIENKTIYQRLFNNGIDILCTNYPFLAKKFRYFYYKNRRQKGKYFL